MIVNINLIAYKFSKSIKKDDVNIRSFQGQNFADIKSDKTII